ncbi:MAG: type I glyceraldehyde-3-phosphate dehydrogenase, partial [Oscillospiraceae bacterium]|nr:type I glyceraldehyde-3-phosphate dehydrogenase [Oscillospiraceae bacterium]
MSVKVAINGFGRIGRLAFRQMFGAEGFEVVAINDLTSPAMLAHLLKYDSTQGNYAAQGHVVEAGEDNIVVDGKKITIYAKANAAELPWGELGVDVVLECTGRYTDATKAVAHLEAGAKKVLISAPGKNDDLTVCYGINHQDFDPKIHNIISNASCTTNG